jgi:hypothetical protein
MASSGSDGIRVSYLVFLLGYKGTFTSKLSQRNRMFLHYRPRRSSEEVQKLTDSFLVANSESFSSKLPDPRKMVGRMRMQPSIASRRGRLWISPCRKDKENSTSAELIRSNQFNVNRMLPYRSYIYCSICIPRGRASERKEVAIISSLPSKCPRRESDFPHS